MDHVDESPDSVQDERSAPSGSGAASVVNTSRGTPRRLTSDEQRVYANVFARNWHLLLAFALRLTGDRDEAEDLVQEAMVRALMHIDRLSPNGAIGPWLIRVVRNAFCDRQRARRCVRPSSDELIAAMPAPEDTPQPAWKALSADAIIVASDQLPPLLRQPFRLFVAGASYQLIAARLRVRPQTVGTRLHRARRRLRQALEVA